MSYWFWLWMASSTCFWLMFLAFVMLARVNRMLRRQLREERNDRLNELIERGRRDALRDAPGVG